MRNWIFLRYNNKSILSIRKVGSVETSTQDRIVAQQAYNLQLDNNFAE